MDEAAATVSSIIANKIIPCTMEFLDRTTIRCIEEYSQVGLPLDCEAILLLESDGHPAAVDDEAQRMATIARQHGARSVSLAKDMEEATKLMTARRMAIPAMARVAPTTILEDATVPRSKLAEMVRFVQKTAEKYKLIVGTFGHFGDGNLHPTFLANELNSDEIHRVHQAVAEIFEYAVKLGGTISGEHGIGLTKKSFLAGAIGEINVRVLREIKRVFDPKGVLNPTKIFEQEGQSAATHALHMISSPTDEGAARLVPQT
jgi:glycolate oxidase